MEYNTTILSPKKTNSNLTNVDLSRENFLNSPLLQNDDYVEYVQHEEFEHNIQNSVSQSNSSQDYSQDCVYEFLAVKNKNYYAGSSYYNNYLQNINSSILYEDNSEYSQIEDTLYPKSKVSFCKKLKHIFCCCRY